MSDIQKVLVPAVGREEAGIIDIGVSVGATLEAEDGVITVDTANA